MKKLIFAAAITVASVAFCGEIECGKACKGECAAPEVVPASMGEPEVVPAKKPPERSKESIEARRAKHIAAREAAEKRAAEKLGITVEELRAQRKTKAEERMAKRFGMSVEDFRKLTPEERKAKGAELRAKRLAEYKARQAANDAKVAEPVAEPKTEESK